MDSSQAGPGPSSGTGRYRFRGVVVDAHAHTLTRDGQLQPLEPKAFAVLLALLRQAGDLVPREQLLDTVWGHRHVTPGVLTRAIAQLRTALDDDSHQPRFIQTQHALGYRFIAALEPPDAAAEAAPPGPPTRAAPADPGQMQARMEGRVGEAPAAAPVAEAALAVSAEAPADAAPAAAVAAPGQAAAAVAVVPGRRGRRASDAFPPMEPPRPRRRWGWLALAALLLMAIAAWWWTLHRPALPPRPSGPSVAVLPFASLSDDRRDRYFAEGLSAEMLSALAGEHGLTVAAWQPPEAIDRRLDVRTLGRKLGVATLLDASVRRDGPQLRISARLSDTASGLTLWSRTYESDAAAVFDTQSQIAGEVARLLLGGLPDAGAGLRKRLTPTRDPAAFDAYLMGVYQLLRPSQAGGHGAMAQSFQRALASDAGFARAQAGLCRAYLWSFESNRDAAAFEDARLACLRARNMDQGIGEVGLALGDLYRITGDFERAGRQYGALEHDPAMRPAALVGLAKIDVERGQVTQALDKFRSALAASPGNAQVHAELGYQQYAIGRLPDALESYRRAVELRPDLAEYWSIYGALLQAAGDNAASARALERALAIEPSEAVLSNLGTLRFQEGHYAAAADFYRRATTLNPGNFLVWGNLGEALLADPATAAQARPAFQRAAGLAQGYVRLRPAEAPALAALGWYQANLGQHAQALAQAGRAEAADARQPDVAVFNAQTFAVLGQPAQARQRIAAARAAGAPASRIDTNPVFRRHGLLAGTGASANATPDVVAPRR